jgi:hypothetical protein
MLRTSHRFLGFLALLLMMAGVAFAQTTGSASGVVRDGDGAPLPGVTVTVSGPLLPAGRSTVTDEKGAWSILRLPPGAYTVLADLSGLGNAKREAVVALDKDTQVDLTLSPTVSDAITVQAALPVIDVKSSEAQVNYTSETIESLPIARTYKGIFQLAPGVAENQRFAPNAGGSRMDNLYLVDGINITNPHYGDILPDITELDIAEVSIKRGGVTAELGRTGGMVVNAITKSGTNEFGGEIRAEYQPSNFVSDNKNSTVQNTRDRELIAGSLGGPILRDRVWFYGSVNMPSVTTTERRNNLGGVPDEELETDEYFGKITANPLPSHFLSASLRSRDSTTSNANITANVSPTASSNDSTDYLLGTAGWIWNVTSDSLLDFKVTHDEEQNSTDPRTNLGYRPAFNAARPDLVGRFTTTADRIVGGATTLGQIVGGSEFAVNNDDFEREEARLTYQRFATLGDTRHDIRTGVTYEKSEEVLERRANGWSNISWNAATQQFTASYVSAQPPHTARGEATGIFLQDQVTFGERLTLTAGVLVNKDEYFGEALGSTPGTKRKKKILTFDWDQQIQPRLGLSWVPSERGDKLYGSFGRYMNTENKSLGRAASPTRIFTTRATFDANGNLLTEVPAANTQTKTVDSNLDPMYTDEYLIGYARPLSSTWTAEVWGMYREVGDIFEDVSADGLGNGPFRVSQLPDAYREYTAATLQVDRRPIDARFRRLWISASYTWSRLEGNWDIDYGPSSLFYNSSFIQDGPGVLITDNRDGLLRGDRTHVAKLFATIEPIERLRTGAYLRYQSGAAWEARGLPDANVSSSSHFRYLERAGSRRMEDWMNVDLLASYEFRFAGFGGLGLEIEGRVNNLFDEQAILDVDDRLIVGRATAPNNPSFGQGTVFSPPRAFVLSAIVRY